MDRIRKHLEDCHDTTSNAGDASSRILRLAQAIYNWGQIAGRNGALLGAPTKSGGYLERASVEIAGWVGAGWGDSAHLHEGKIAQIDRHIRLPLGPEGPRYMVPSKAEQYRRNGYA